MIDFRRAPVARVLVPLAGGSLVGYMGSPAVSPGVVLIACLLLWLVLLLIDQLFREKPFFHAGLFSSLVFGLVFCTGLGLGMTDEPEDPGLPVGERIMISGKMLEGPVERNGRLEYEMRL
ncbi:MAG: hypothetical protein KAT15_29905, partial [Bacteroidales bacterium]|nr:hypothetical protein [Bacteroidales bacterium]